MSDTVSGQRLNRKTVLILFILLVTLIPSSVNTPRVEATGESWLTGWNYRKSLNITGSTVGVQTNYSIQVSAYYDSLPPSPLQDTSSQGWISSVYSNYSGEDRIYLFYHDDLSDNLISAWSFNRADVDNPSRWTDLGVIYTGTADQYFIEPHGLIFETQTMADLRESVGEGLGTRMWRMYICCRGLAEGTPFSDIHFLYADESDLTSWTSFGEVYGHNATFGFGDPKVVIHNGEVWMMLGAYPAVVTSFFTHSENGTNGWTDVYATFENTYLYGSLVSLDDDILMTRGFPGTSNFSAYSTDDGVTYSAYSENPILTGFGGWDSTTYGWNTIPVDKTGESDLAGLGTHYLFYWASGLGVNRLGMAKSTTITDTKYLTNWTKHTESINLNEKCETDFGDIRFTSSDGITEIDYWMKDKVDSDYAEFEVLFPNIPIDPDEGVGYMYYGKAGAVTTSSDFRDNFTTFTEVDTGNDRIQKTAYHVDHGATRNEDTYLYKDMTVDHFGNFQYTIKIRSDFATDGGACPVWMLANLVQDWAGIIAASGDAISVSFHRAAASYKIALYETDGGTTFLDEWTTGAMNTWYYLKISKNGTSLKCEIFSDKAMLTLLDTLSLTLHEDYKFRYVYAVNTYNDGAGLYLFNNDIDNFYSRKYTDPDPEISVWGSEETESAPSNNDPTVTSFVISDLSDGVTLFKTLWYRPVMVVDDDDGLSDIGTSYFSFETDYGWHNVSYNYQTDVYAVPVGGGRIIIANGYTESSGTSLTIHFYLMCLEPIDVKNNVDVYCRVTDISSGDSDWSLEQSDYFNILDYVEDIGGSSSWTPDETPSEEPQEEWIDSDGDGIPNWDDPDVDGDWVPNEYDPDIDGDGIPNELDPEPFIPAEVEKPPIIFSFKTPSGAIINIINPLYYLKPYQKIIVPFIFILLAIILISMYAKREEEKENKGKIAPQISTGGYGRLEELKRRR